MIADLAAGIAAEHLVVADLILAGHRAYLTDQTAPYDIVAETPRGLVRIQVKATRKAETPRGARSNHTPTYLFQMNHTRAGELSEYGADFDIAALVALDTKCIAYKSRSDLGRYLRLRPIGSSKRGARHPGNIDEYPFGAALESTRHA